MILEAVRNTDMLPTKQKNTLEVICAAEHPVYAKEIEEKLHSTTPQISFCLKALMKREFITREKDGKFLYKPNPRRIEDIVKRYKSTK